MIKITVDKMSEFVWIDSLMGTKIFNRPTSDKAIKILKSRGIDITKNIRFIPSGSFVDDLKEEK